MSNKIVDGVELLRMIRDEEIKEGTKINWGKTKLYFDGDSILYEENKTKLTRVLWDKNFARQEFEILSKEDKEIDVQRIFELPIFDDKKLYDNGSIDVNRETINALIKAVKQLDKEIKNK